MSRRRFFILCVSAVSCPAKYTHTHTRTRAPVCHSFCGYAYFLRLFQTKNALNITEPADTAATSTPYGAYGRQPPSAAHLTPVSGGRLTFSDYAEVIHQTLTTEPLILSICDRRPPDWTTRAASGGNMTFTWILSINFILIFSFIQLALSSQVCGINRQYSYSNATFTIIFHRKCY